MFENGACCYKGIRTRGRSGGGSLGCDPAIDLNPWSRFDLCKQGMDLTYLIERGLNECLSGKSRVNRHHKDQVNER
jgi:hypothetical protein